MLRLTLWLILIAIGFNTNAQNLVRNPSFEDTVTCPFADAQIYYAEYWFQPSKFLGDIINSCSSEYYHECSSAYTSSAPFNWYGHQYPKTGKGYAGIICYTETLNNYREYVEVSLNSPLIAGQTYCVEFYVSLADSSNTAIANIGAFLSPDSNLYNSFQNLPNSPQIYNDPSNIITNENSWSLVAGQFCALGGERFITIGNFEPDASTNSQAINGTHKEGYYYIDDVAVYLCGNDNCLPIDSFSLSVPNVFTPNGDGINDLFQISSTGLSELGCEIFNRWGVKIGEMSAINDVWDGRTTSGEQAVDGVYYYVVIAKDIEGQEHSLRGIVHLIR